MGVAKTLKPEIKIDVVQPGIGGGTLPEQGFNEEKLKAKPNPMCVECGEINCRGVATGRKCLEETK